MAGRSLFPLVDMALGGTLAERLRHQRAEGMSYEDITHRLRDDGIEVTRETVRKWCLEVEDRAEGDAA